MSDTSQGPGWWIASDGKWYSPEQKPGPVTPEPPAPVTPPPVAPETPPVAVEPPTEPIPVTPPAAAPPMGAPPMVPPGTPPPMVTPPAGGYAAPPPMAAPAAPPPEKKSNGCLKAAIIVSAIIVVLGIGTFVALAFLVNKGVDTVNDKLKAQQKVEQRTGIKTSSFNTEHPPQDDLGDWKCSTTPSGFPQVTGSVKNNSSHTSSYAIVVEFKQNGTQFSTGSGLVVSVDPGQTTDFSATGSVKPDGQFTCRIDSMDRTDIGNQSGN
jgi:hypothetical protein